MPHAPEALGTLSTGPIKHPGRTGEQVPSSRKVQDRLERGSQPRSAGDVRRHFWLSQRGNGCRLRLVGRGQGWQNILHHTGQPHERELSGPKRQLCRLRSPDLDRPGFVSWGWRAAGLPGNKGSPSAMDKCPRSVTGRGLAGVPVG